MYGLFCPISDKKTGMNCSSLKESVKTEMKDRTETSPDMGNISSISVRIIIKIPGVSLLI